MRWMTVKNASTHRLKGRFAWNNIVSVGVLRQAKERRHNIK